MFTKIPIDSLNYDKVERLRVISVELFFENLMYVSNTWNENFYDLPLYGYQSLISGQRIYFVNDDIIEMLNNFSISDVYTNWM